MKLTDAPVTELIRTCAGQGRDTFFAFPAPPSLPEMQALSGALDGRLLVLLPGTVYPCGHRDVSVFNTPQDMLGPPEQNVLFTDIRLIGAPEFAAYFTEYGFRYILLPFYETALKWEYGYKFSYRQVSELRASLPFAVHLIGVSARDRKDDALFETFGTREYAVLEDNVFPRLSGQKTENENEKFRLTARQCEASAFRKQIVLCATRTEGVRLQAFLHTWGIRAALFHGGQSKEENAAALRAFTGNEAHTLVATKSLIPSYPFIHADKVYCFGLPYSISHADRCAALSAENALICIWCDEDIVTLQTQTEAFIKALQIDDPAFSVQRKHALDEVLLLLAD